MKRFLFGMALTCVTLGCGGGDDKEKNLDPFLGEWTITQGDVAVDCGLIRQNNPLTGVVTVSKGATSDLVMKLSDPRLRDCSLQLAVKNDEARVPMKQTCLFTVQGVPGTFLVESGTFRLAEGMKANVNLSGTANAQLGGNVPALACTGLVTAGLVKGSSPPDAGADSSN